MKNLSVYAYEEEFYVDDINISEFDVYLLDNIRVLGLIKDGKKYVLDNFFTYKFIKLKDNENIKFFKKIKNVTSKNIKFLISVYNSLHNLTSGGKSIEVERELLKHWPKGYYTDKNKIYRGVSVNKRLISSFVKTGKLVTRPKRLLQSFSTNLKAAKDFSNNCFIFQVNPKEYEHIDIDKFLKYFGLTDELKPGKLNNDPHAEDEILVYSKEPLLTKDNLYIPDTKNYNKCYKHFFNEKRNMYEKLN